MAEQLAGMPCLRELLLMKGFHCSSEVVCDPCGTFERLLLSLKRLTSLQSLQVIAMNDSVSLSRYGANLLVTERYLHQLQKTL